MFGKPAWFRKKRLGWGLRPVAWQGWLYTLAWIAAICAPFIALLATVKIVEALVWVVVMMVALLWDVRQVMRQMDAVPSHAAGNASARNSRDPDEGQEVLFIDDDSEPDLTPHATRRYELHVRR